jgi:hypothetical protein
MSLRDAVLTCGIIRGAINWPQCPLAGDAALELALNFLRAALFQRISATARDQRERAQDRQGLHLLILGSQGDNAIAE